MTPRSLCAAAALAAATLLSACNPAPDGGAPAEMEAASSPIAVSSPWSRETAAGQDAGGAFMTITNTGTAPDRLTGGSTKVAGQVQIHTVDMAGGVMRMRQLADGLEIPAGGSVTLKPGSFHVMLMQLQQPLKQGETVPLTLTFDKAGPVDVALTVQPVGAGAPMGHAAGGDHE